MNIACEDKEWLSYFQKCLGYSISGETSAQVFFIWLGNMGSNGKGFLSRCMKAILTDAFFVVIKKSVIIHNPNQNENTEGPSVETLKLKQERFALSTEIRAGEAFNTDQIKRITGEDDLTGRAHHGYPEQFITQNKIHAQLNVCARFPNADTAFRRRPIVAPFDALFVDSKSEQQRHQITINNYMKEIGKLKKDETISPPQFLKVYLKNSDIEKRLQQGDLKNYFFSWLVDGAIGFYKEGIKNNIASRFLKAKEQVVADLDVVGTFREEYLTYGDGVESNIRPSELHRHFLCWLKARNNNENMKFSMKAFNSDFRKKGHITKKHQGNRFWQKVDYQ
jgi:phage/plasmid-associated DNA primase